MKKLILLAVAIAAAVGLCSSAMAAIPPVTDLLFSTVNNGDVRVVCNVTAPSPGQPLFRYVYDVTNQANPVELLKSFTLEFLGGDSVASFTNITDPNANWSHFLVSTGGQNKIDWVTTADMIGVNQTRQFTFFANNPPNLRALASAQDGSAFSGHSCGPAPAVPEPSSIALVLMGVGSLYSVRRMRRS